MPMINTYHMTVGNREFFLVDVSKSHDIIGTTIVSRASGPMDHLPVSEILYCGKEAVINMIRPAKGNEFSDKLVYQISTTTAVNDENMKTILSSVGDSYFTYQQSITRALHPFLELLSEGIYVCHDSKMIPSNGSGEFFWSAYTHRREVPGTAAHSRTMGKDSNFIPCFLIPTTSPAEFTEAKVRAQREKIIAGKKVGGLAYHMSGMFSALLDGHHSAAACLLGDTEFRCIVVEPLHDVLYESPEQAAQYGREPRIVALSCPYVKIPIEQIPPAMLESFLLRRSGVKPQHFAILRNKAFKTLQTVKRKPIPREILLKAELLPDVSAMESAHAITELTDEQLDALLAGEIKYDDKIIISQNYYNSIITACNYLQYEDFDRFFNFASAIVENPDLTATHKYIIERLCGLNNKKIHDFFVSVMEKEDPFYKDHIPCFETYIKSYQKHLSDNLKDKNNRAQKLSHAMGILGGEVSDSSLAQMEAIARTGRGGRG
ncbi:MAG: hypothetical protein LBC86_06370 [Oscillospiraceae bacterium]|jgi:hypothetical protein|nr:hypothetical protein [Oscillospiraceae bacterium]